jgi:formylglycine-generating enzyme required for sulfatase activity
MPLPEFCGGETAMELMRRARLDVNDTAPRLILADWLERMFLPESQEMCRVLRASFDGNDTVPLSPEMVERLHPLTGARGGWFSGPWLGHGGELERLWLASPCVVELPGDVSVELEQIPAGTFKMGSPEIEADRWDDETLHEVTISKPFYLGKYPVTQSQWQAVMGSNPSYFKVPQRPVEQVSWEDAVEFCKRLSEKPGERESGWSYRLPTEAEWEYACRAGSQTAYSFGDDARLLKDFAWFSDNSNSQTHPVGRKKPNAWGLYDMHGNVWEWCGDWYGDYPRGSVTDPTGPNEGPYRVGRGGSGDYGAAGCRSAFRDGPVPSVRGHDYGFRVALSSSGIPK